MENAMATQSTESPSTVTKQQNPSPNQNVYLMPITTPRTMHIVPGVRCLSITQIIIGSLLVILGIAGAVLKARGSYSGFPIWTGLLFFVVTGILGVFVYIKKTVLCMNIAFMVMCIVSCVFAVQLMLTSWIFASTEEHIMGYHQDNGTWFAFPMCRPSLGYVIECANIPGWKRALIGLLIGFVALAGFVILIVSCSLTMYGSFNCCYRCCACCRSSPNTTLPYTIQYTPQGVVLKSLDGQQVITPQLLPTQPSTAPQPVVVGTGAVQPITITSGSNETGTDDQDGGQVASEVKIEDGKAVIETGVELTGDEEPPEKVADDPENWQTFEK